MKTRSLIWKETKRQTPSLRDFSSLAFQVNLERKKKRKKKKSKKERRKEKEGKEERRNRKKEKKGQERRKRKKEKEGRKKEKQKRKKKNINLPLWQLKQGKGLKQALFIWRFPFCLATMICIDPLKINFCI